MSIDFKKCSEEELWKYVASHLKRNGIDTILVGGAVVSIYSKGAYRSGDLDFVLASLFADYSKAFTDSQELTHDSRPFTPQSRHKTFVEFSKKSELVSLECEKFLNSRLGSILPQIYINNLCLKLEIEPEFLVKIDDPKITIQEKKAATERIFLELKPMLTKGG
jgi:hypothetical protein